MGIFKGLSWVLMAGLLSACHHGGGTDFNLEPLSPLPGVSDWSMSGGGPSHAGYVPVTLDASKFSARWSVAVPQDNSHICVQVAALDRCTYVGQVATDSVDGHVVVVTTGEFFQSDGSDNLLLSILSLNESDGSMAWGNPIIGLSDDILNMPTFAFGPPSVADGKVYVSNFQFDFTTQANAKATLYAFDAKTGHLAFTVYPPCSGICGTFGNTQAVISDSTVYEGTPLSAFDADTGALRWTSAVGDSDPAVAPGALYLSESDGFSAVQPASGSLQYQIKGSSQSGFQTAPMLDGMGGAVVAHLGSPETNGALLTPARGYLDHYSLATRVRDWTVRGDFSVVMRPAVAQGVVYACDGAVVKAYSVSDGTLLWSWTGDSSLQDDGGGNSNCSLIATRNLLFVSSYQTTTALDLGSHTAVWSWPEGGQLSLSPSGLLYITVASPASAHLVAINLH